eukprot:gene20098-22843_t
MDKTIDHNSALEVEDHEEQNVEGDDGDLQVLPAFTNGKEISHYMRDLPRSMAATGKTRTYSRVFKLLKSRDMLPIELQSVRTYSVMNPKQHSMLVLVLESITNTDVGLMERLHCAVHNTKYTGNTPSTPVSDYTTLLAKAMAGGMLPLEAPTLAPKSSSAVPSSRPTDQGNTTTSFLSAPMETFTATSSTSGAASSNSGQSSSWAKKQKTQQQPDLVSGQVSTAAPTSSNGIGASLSTLLNGTSTAQTSKTARKLQKKVIMAELEQSLLQKRKDGDIANLRAALTDPALDFDAQERKKMKTKLLELMGVGV